MSDEPLSTIDMLKPIEEELRALGATTTVEHFIVSGNWIMVIRSGGRYIELEQRDKEYGVTLDGAMFCGHDHVFDRLDEAVGKAKALLEGL